MVYIAYIKCISLVTEEICVKRRAQLRHLGPSRRRSLCLTSYKFCDERERERGQNIRWHKQKPMGPFVLMDHTREFRRPTYKSPRETFAYSSLHVSSLSRPVSLYYNILSRETRICDFLYFSTSINQQLIANFFIHFLQKNKIRKIIFVCKTKILCRVSRNYWFFRCMWKKILRFHERETTFLTTWQFSAASPQKMSNIWKRIYFQRHNGLN